MEKQAASNNDILARLIASHGLVGANAAPDCRPSDDWSGLVDRLIDQRLVGLAIRSADDGALELTAGQYDELLEHLEMQLAIDLRIERLVLACFDALSAAGVEARLLKGPAAARRFYADPSLRSFGDADILVESDALEPAMRALAALGLRRRSDSPRRSFDRFVKAVCLIEHNGLQVDLHRALTPGPYGVLIDTAALFETTPDSITLGNTAVACLAPELALVHACAHAVLGDPRPRAMSVRDIAEISSFVDGAKVATYVRQFQLEPVAARALHLVETELDCSLAHAVFEEFRAYGPTRRDRWRLASYEGTGARFAKQSAATLWELPSLRDRVTYAWALAVPQPRYLHSRGETYLGRLRRATALALKWRPR